MFKSEPFCALTAGETIDGRMIEQQDIDDAAETYDPKFYNARINSNHNHSEYSTRLGSVLSAEARGPELWLEIKPNSHLLRNIEYGQLLHTSAELRRNFRGTGKTYLKGLAMTDEPASVGTTEMHLSSTSNDKDTLIVAGNTVSTEHFSEKPADELTLIQKITNLLSRADKFDKEQLSNQEESEEMSKKTEELLEQSIEQNKQTNLQLSKLVEHLSAEPEEAKAPEQKQDSEQAEENKEVTELKGQVENLSTQVSSLSETMVKLSGMTDEDERSLAGKNGQEKAYY